MISVLNCVAPSSIIRTEDDDQMGKFILGILVGFFVIPVIITDPQKTFNITQNILEKMVEVTGYIGGVIQLGTFWTFGSYIGDKRTIVDLESERDQRVYNLEHKIRDWKICEQRIKEIDSELRQLRTKVAKGK